MILTAALISPPTVLAGAPLESIQKQVNNVLDVLREPAIKNEDGRDAMQERIEAIAEDIFDYNELSRRALGRYWKKLNAEEKEEFTELFSKLLAGVYMERIITYTDEKVIFEKENMFSEDQGEVQSKVISGSNEIPIHYRVIKKNGSWKVYDVIIEGVSLIKNYRGQFRQILTNKSPEDLLQILRRKVARA
jgi:phospholipid transport system substrate-binding protein